MTTESEKAPQAGVYHMEYVGADTVRLTPVASLTADAAGAAGEYVLVPREPTEAMFREALRDNLSEQRARTIYTHMLAASPTPPASEGAVAWRVKGCPHWADMDCCSETHSGWLWSLQSAKDHGAQIEYAYGASPPPALTEDERSALEQLESLCEGNRKRGKALPNTETVCAALRRRAGK